MPVEWAQSIAVPIFNGKGDIRLQLLQCGEASSSFFKVVEGVLEKRLCKIVTRNECL